MTSTSPTPSSFGCLQYHPGLGGLVLLSINNYVSSTWLYKSSNWSLLQSGVLNNPLPVVINTAMCYDAVADLVQFGGRGLPSTNLSDATNAMSSSGVWFSLLGNDGYNSNLTGREQMYMATLSGGAYLFGGISSDNFIHSDVWKITNASGVWSQVATTGSPTPRLGACFASNGTNQIVSGFGANTSWLLNSFDSFNGTAWTNVIANFASGNPLARKNACMAWSPTLSAYIIFGGENSSGALCNDTYSLTISGSVGTITKLNLTNNIPARTGAMMAFDTTSSELIVFGGRDEYQNRQETYSFINSTVGWVQL